MAQENVNVPAPSPRPEYRVVGYSYIQGLYELNKDGYQIPFEIDASRGEVVAKYSFVAQQIKWLQKDVLEILEASITNERQLEALKRITKSKFSHKLDWIFEQMGKDELELNMLSNIGTPDDVNPA